MCRKDSCAAAHGDIDDVNARSNENDTFLAVLWNDERADVEVGIADIPNARSEEYDKLPCCAKDR